MPKVESIRLSSLLENARGTKDVKIVVAPDSSFFKFLCGAIVQRGASKLTM